MLNPLREVVKLFKICMWVKWNLYVQLVEYRKYGTCSDICWNVSGENGEIVKSTHIDDYSFGSWWKLISWSMLSGVINDNTYLWF